MPKFCGDKIFSYICGKIKRWVELKTIKRKWALGGRGVGRIIFITILLQFHYFTSLETANDQRSEVFLLWISLENVNASADTCWYPQIYNFCSRKELLETLWAYLSRISTTSSTKPFVKNSTTSCVSSLQCLSE